jgi:hypothetical protein
MEFFNIFSETNTISESIDLIVKNWPKEYNPQNKFLDYYGNNLFFVMYNTKDPIEFYEPMVQRKYDELLKKNAIPGLEPTRVPRVLFKEVNGKAVFGDPDGSMYNVYFLAKDFSKFPSEPLTLRKLIMEKNPRTGLFESVDKVIKKQGKFPFIVRYIGTNQVGEPQEVWTEIPPGVVKTYPLNYDSCDRFRNQQDCHGPGINNSTCQWKNNKCQANYDLPYSFGKVKRKVKIHLKKAKTHYSLKDNAQKRHRDLNLRVKLEKKKKKCNLRQAAIAVKRRLVVLRTYRKNNPKMKKQRDILNSDIKFLDKKYRIKLK